MSWSDVKSVPLLATLLCTTACAENPFDLGGPRDCTIGSQNEWVYAALQEVYLWHEELPTVDPLAFDSPEALLAEVRYAKLDRWSRISDAARTTALFEEGKVVSLGFRTARAEDGRLLVSFVYPDSPAERAGLRRGDEIVAIEGLSITQIDEQGLWSDVYGANEPGVSVRLHVHNGDLVELDLTKDWVAIVTVPLADVYTLGARNVGYLFFSTFVETSFDALDEAFAGFVEAGVRDVVIDLRYNGGGLISVARHLANLLVGKQAHGRTAYRLEYTESLSEYNVRRELQSVKHSLEELDSVVFVTTRSTLSASELVINMLRPYAEVRVVGGRTGGKPVGSKQWEFCDKVLVPITCRLLNADGVGDYFDGFPPDCPAPDDLDHQLGDPSEGSLAQALHLVETGACLDPAADEGAHAPPVPRSAPRPLPLLHPDEALRGYL